MSEKLLESVKIGNLNEFTKLFTPEDINYKDKYGNTLMIIALRVMGIGI